MHNVVITGLGLVTPLGIGVAENWQSLISGKAGISQPNTFNFGDHPCRALGLVPDISSPLETAFPLAKQRKTERFIHLAALAAHQAMTDAGISTQLPEQRDMFGSYIGVGIGGVSAISQATRAFDQRGARSISPFLIPRTISSEAASWLAMEWNLQGPMLTYSNACASSADAIGHAYRMIRHGYADYMLTGGSESSLNPISFAGFAKMRALSTWHGDIAASSRPFDSNRSGFVMAEGAAMLVLERKDLALRRGASIIAEIVGYGAKADAYHITSVHPHGRGAQHAMRSALKEAVLNADQIGYVNAHGTGTPMNDPVETFVLKEVLGSKVQDLKTDHTYVSSTKSMMGHALGAAGAIECAFTALSLKHQVAPPTINLDSPSKECDLDYVPRTARNMSAEYALSNSFGFGGGNAVLALKRFV